MSTIPPPSMLSILPASIAPSAFQHGDPCTLVIFGAAGDLSRRKLFPAIYLLARQGLLAKDFAIVGVGIEPLDDEKLRAMMKEALGKSDEVKGLDEEVWADLSRRMHWVGGDLTKGDVYAELGRRLGEIEKAFAPERQNRLFYLSVPPGIFATIVEQLSSSGLCPRQKKRDRPWRRVICEKPFGTSLGTAKKLGSALLGAVDEHQIYRIDHYVGKETVQNVLVARSANAIFEALWNRAHISHVQITAAETVGLEGRGGYYEKSGVLRDMFQNHLLQLLALTAMEEPLSFAADDVRAEKEKVLRAVKLPRELGKHTSRGQYANGWQGGVPVVGYLEEQGIDPHSTTETYAAIRVDIENRRWAGVPFYLRTGKRLGRRVTEVAVVFKRAPHLPFAKTAVEELSNNAFVFRIQPDEGITVRFGSKVPNTSTVQVRDVTMDFQYGESFVDSSPEAYERLILDVLLGDPPLFPRHEEVELGWQVLDPVLDYWAANGAPEQYASGGWGPASSYDMIARDGRTWRRP